MADQVSGTPSQAGTFKPVFVATDANGKTSSPLELDITIAAGQQALTVVTTTLNTGTNGHAYSQQLNAAGGTGTGYTWTLNSGSLSGSGISLSSGGLLSGTAATGTYSGLQFSVTDSGNNTAFSAFMTLTVTAGTVTLAVTTINLGNAIIGQAYSQQLMAQGGTPPYTWTLNSGSLSGSGITLGSSGLLSGNTPGAGSFGPLVFKATDSASNTALSGPLTLNVVAAAPTLYPLPIVVEILINGTWVDISTFVYQRDGIQISGGRASRTDQKTNAQMTLTVNNRDGRFSVGTPVALAVWGGNYLTRNTQIRVSVVNATSSSGNVYTGYRFWGTVNSWPQQSDISGKDVYAQITCSGPLRRIYQGGGEGSALTLYYQSLTGLEAPVAYWPVEEDSDATSIGSGPVGSGLGGSASLTALAENMVVVSGSPTWKAVSNFNGSAPIAVINGSTWTGLTGSFGTSGDDLFLEPGTWQWIASTTSVNVKCVGGGGGGTNGATQCASGGAAGGGGEWAGNTAVGVTPGQKYQVTVGQGGAPGGFTAGAQGGTFSQFTGDNGVVITAHGGHGGTAANSYNGPAGAGGAGGTGGTGGATGAHFNGGNGGTSPNFINAGGGGGSSGGKASAGNNGQNSSSGSPSVPGNGGAAVSGGGAGGEGGGGVPETDGTPGRQPGGGGGGGWAGTINYTHGAHGAPGSVELIYNGSQGGTQPNNVVVRFILYVPPHGGNNQAVLLRALLSSPSTIARIDCQYRSGSHGGGTGALRMFGYSQAIGGTQLFDSGNLGMNAGLDGNTFMVSMELAAAQSNVAYKLEAIIPGNKGVGTQFVSGTLAGSMGSVSQVQVAPNGDVTKTAMGHISVQYALVPLWKVSAALDGHQYENTTDRFARHMAEQAMDSITEYGELADHWGFEDGGLNGFTGTNCTISNTSFSYFNDRQDQWPLDGSSRSLQVIPNGTGDWSVTGPSGVGTLSVTPGDIVSISADVYSTGQLNNAYVGIQWYDSNGVFISESDSGPSGGGEEIDPGQPATVRLIGKAAQAPAIANGQSADAQWLTVVVGDKEVLASSQHVHVDNVRLSAHMGVQARHERARFLEEIDDLEQGLLKEAKELWGLKYRTRIRLINQAPALKLDYLANNPITVPLAPVIDIHNVKNDIVVHRHKGSKVQVTEQNGNMSILEPPAGVGRLKKRLRAVAAADEQIAALAQHLLTIGTANDERYPTIAVDLSHCGLPGDGSAPYLSAMAAVEVGDVVELTSLPFWYPNGTSQQMVIGYTETLNTFTWQITWNCITYSPYVQVTSTRRW